MIRAGLPSDLRAITHVRTSVRENHLSVAQMAARGITQAGIVADMEAGHLGTWVAEDSGRVIAFAMADRRDGSIFALFMLPGFESHGFGSALLTTCEDWLRQQGLREATLGTGHDTKARRFYRNRGWIETGAISEKFPEDVCFRKSL